MTNQAIMQVSRTDAAAIPGSASNAVQLATTDKRFAHTEGARVPASGIIWICVLLLAALLWWADQAMLDEVSVGTGKVIPTSREQVIQSLEGGIVTRILVKDGDVVEAGAVLAELDKIRNKASVDESGAKIRALKAAVARLQAEVNDTALTFPPEVRADSELVRYETQLFESRRRGLQDSLSNLNTAFGLVNEELRMSEPLVEKGALSQTEILRLRRQASELRLKIAETKSQYQVRAREELSRTVSEAESQVSVRTARMDVLTRSTIIAPMRGVIKDVQITTVGGVLAPGGKLMEIVPNEDRLVIETKISPKDIAFLHPGQRASVKVTAYDYTIYGTLDGTLERISPDTLQDEVHKDQYYYRAYVKVGRDHLVNKAGQRFPIMPGMIATVDIHTGEKTVAHYLFKPFNKAREALRER